MVMADSDPGSRQVRPSLPGAAALDRDIEAPVRGNKPHAAFRLCAAPIADRFPKSDGAPKSD